MPGGGDWGHVYDVISTLATIDALRQRAQLRIPEDVRQLVEIATHPDYLSEYPGSVLKFYKSYVNQWHVTKMDSPRMNLILDSTC
jgi:hypothetical protein